MAAASPCVTWSLRRRGGSREKFLLREGEEVTLGRGMGVTYQLTSSTCPLMISRVHCIFRQNEKGEWTITDNKSLNGVWLNKVKLEPRRVHVLSEGSCLQLGVPLTHTDKAEFEYDVVKESPGQVNVTPSAPIKVKGSRTKRKLHTEDPELSGEEGSSSCSKAKFPRGSKEVRESGLFSRSSKVAKQRTVKTKAVSSTDGDRLAPTQQQQPCRSTLHLNKVRKAMVEIRRLNEQMQEKQLEMQEKMNDPQQSKSVDNKDVLLVQIQLRDLQNQLSNEQEEHLHHIQELKQIFQEEQQKQGEQKLAEEEHLKEQLAQALQEHTLLMEELNRNKNDFEQIIQAKNKELEATKEEKEKVQAQKEEVLNHMNDVLDNELQCSICSEHFIEAVTLNCSHSFCAFCIKEWRKRKHECPICRQEIHTQTRSLVLDNCIDRMVDKLSAEMKDRRAALIIERKELNPKEDAISIPSDGFSDLEQLFYSSDSIEESEYHEDWYSESEYDDDDDDDAFFI